MIKYLALSTIIVMGVAIVVAGWVNRDLIRIKIASVYLRIAPKPGPSQHPLYGESAALAGDAPWALSALPDCLTQMSKANGSLRFVRAHLPAGAVPIVPPAQLVYGNCTIAITGDEALVRRGADRLRIPPHVQFYRAAGLLVMLRQSSQGSELRTYEPVQQ